MEKQTVKGLMLELIKLVADGYGDATISVPYECSYGCINIVKGYELGYDCSICNEHSPCTNSCIKNKKPDCLILNSDDM